MGQRSKPDKESPPDARVLLVAMADTTWRMFVPTIGLLILGLQMDRAYNTTPWLMLIGLGAGSALSYLLIQRQLKRFKK